MHFEGQGLALELAERCGVVPARLEVHDWPVMVLTQAAVHAREGVCTADPLDGLEPGTSDAASPAVAAAPLSSGPGREPDSS
ncbi:hypothetical protein [Marichromatium gracile]|nr:hypothetical protein [Marichromatium gracile]